MEIPQHGGCLCGSVRYRVDAEPLTVYACHCTDCQRRTGSVFGISMVLRRESVHVLSGELHAYRIVMPDGRTKNGRICSNCGSRLFGDPALAPALVVVQPGTLDDRSWVRPLAHIWTRSAQPWVRLPDDARIYATQPQDMAELFSL
ncbi:MAG TPA: GFA family protein [Candidatus Binatia bacterium]